MSVHLAKKSVEPLMTPGVASYAGKASNGKDSRY